MELLHEQAGEAAPCPDGPLAVFRVVREKTHRLEELFHVEQFRMRHVVVSRFDTSLLILTILPRPTGSLQANVPRETVCTLATTKSKPAYRDCST